MLKTILNPPSLAKPSGFAHGILTEGGRTILANFLKLDGR